MAKRNHKKRNIIRCQATGKIINGKGAIIADKKVIIEYLKKHGYKITPPINMIIGKAGFVSAMVILLASLFLVPFISAVSTLYAFDLAQASNRAIMYVYFIISGVLFFTRKYLFSGTMLILGAILLAFNNVNLIIALVILMIGILVIEMED